MVRTYLGPLPRPAIGVRLPDIIIPPVLKAFKNRSVAGTLMLSYHRETAPTDVIKLGKHILLGHTGTSISEYISKATKLANVYNVTIDVEADHVSLMASPERAIKRITEKVFEYGLTKEEINESLNYIEKEFKEVKKAGGVDFVTIDTCELIDLSADNLSINEVLAKYEDKVEKEVRKELEKRYVGRLFKFFTTEGDILIIKFSREDVARLAVKYLESVKYVKVIYDIVNKYIGDKDYGVEIALDEIPQLTNPKDLIFYLNELRNQGIDPDFVAPNIGFKKREDYVWDLPELARKVSILHSIASSFGALLSIHSGSGAHPYSDKGLGTWETLKKVTGGAIKYKVSGVYVQLLLEVMSKFPQGSEPRKLYEEIFDTVLDYLKKDLKSKKGLYSPHLEKIIKEYEESVSKDKKKLRDPRADFFRHYFFIFQAVIDAEGRRYLRDKLIDVYFRNKELKEVYEKEAYQLTLRIIDKLGFSYNQAGFKLIRY